MKTADDIIAAVCAEQGITIEQLLESGLRTGAVCEARNKAITRLWAQHFSARWIANALHISMNSVHYRIYPAAKQRQRRGQDKMNAERRAIRATMVRA